MQRWFANLIEITQFLHQNKIVHRYLNPCGIFLRYDPGTHEGYYSDLYVGDFGIPTVLKDLKTKTRFETNAFDHMAPEVIDGQAHDYKSDIWSFGAIMLDACTTESYNVI